MEKIGRIFLDLLLLYKNFFHWNISKLIIYLFSIALGLLLALPFWGIMFVIIFFDPIDWRNVFLFVLTGNLGLNFLENSSNGFFYIIFEVILFVLGVLGFIFGYSYNFITKLNLSLNYLNGQKLGFIKNIYFNFLYIKKYFFMLNWFGLFFLLFLLIIFIIIFILSYIFGLFNLVNLYSNIFFVSSILFVFLSLFFIFLYYMFRLFFGYLILIDSKEDLIKKEKGINFLKKSYGITGGFGKALLFLFFVLVFFIFSFIIDIFLTLIRENLSFGVNFLIFIFLFLLFDGIFEMFLASFYKRVLVFDNRTYNDTDFVNKNNENTDNEIVDTNNFDVDNKKEY